MPTTHQGSTTQSITIICPSCDGEFDLTVWSAVNGAEDPALKTYLLDGRLNQFECPCGTQSSFEADLAYYDLERGYAVMLEYTDYPRSVDLEEIVFAPGEFPPLRLRTVDSWNALLEKIHLFDAALDDRVVELMKLQLMADLPAELRSKASEIRCSGPGKTDDGDEGLRFWLFVEGQDRLLSTVTPRRDTYDPLSALVRSVAPETASGRQEWQVVDAAFAAKLATSLEQPLRGRPPRRKGPAIRPRPA